jgi:hypothetical protein
MATGAPSLGVKRPEHEADHSLPSSAEVKEFGKPYLCSPNTSSWCGVQLKKKKHRDNFTLMKLRVFCDSLMNIFLETSGLLSYEYIFQFITFVLFDTVAPHSDRLIASTVTVHRNNCGLKSLLQYEQIVSPTCVMKDASTEKTERNGSKTEICVTVEGEHVVNGFKKRRRRMLGFLPSRNV